MFEQLRWILASYLTRPRLMIVVGCAAAMTAGLWSVSTSQQALTQNFPQMPMPRLMVHSQATLDEVRRLRKQQEVDGIDLQALWMDVGAKKKWDETLQRETRQIDAAPEEFYRILQEFPNLRWVRYGLTPDSIGQAELAQVAGLEYLVLEGLPQLDLARLRPLKKLRRIDFKMVSAPSNIAALADLPNLETLVFESRFWVGDTVLKELSRSPRLKALALAFNRHSGPEEPLTTDGFAALRASKTLDTLYVGGWPQKDYTELLALAKAALPGRKVLPALVPALRFALPMMMLAPCLLLSLALGMQLVSQFRHPLVRLAPGFASSHAFVGVMLCVAIIVLGAARLWSVGARQIPALLMSADLVLSAIAIAVSGFLVELTGSQEPRRRFQYGAWALFGLCGILFTPGFADRVMFGDSSVPFEIAFMAIVAGGAGTWIWSRLSGLSSELGDATSDSVGSRDVPSARNFRPGWFAPAESAERQIENFPSADMEWNYWSRILRWRLGNAPLRIVGLVSFLLLPCGFLLLPQVRFGAAFIGGPMSVPIFVLPLIMQQFWIFIGIVGIISVRWRSRLRIASLELTRPYARRSMLAELIVGQCAELAPVCVCAAALAACELNLDASFEVDWGRVPIDFIVYLVVALVLAVEHGALTVMIERVWLMIAAHFLAVMVNFGTLAALLVSIPNSDSVAWTRWTPLTVEYRLWAPTLVAAIVACACGARFFRMEFGRRA